MVCLVFVTREGTYEGPRSARARETAERDKPKGGTKPYQKRTVTNQGRDNRQGGTPPPLPLPQKRWDSKRENCERLSSSPSHHEKKVFTGYGVMPS